MQKSLHFLLVICFVAMFALLPTTNAQDPTAGSKEDNACNEGGSMAGKCDTEWAWTCGWYIARWESGIFTRSQVIDSCASLLAPYSIEVALCYDSRQGPSSLVQGQFTKIPLWLCSETMRPLMNGYSISINNGSIDANNMFNAWEVAFSCATVGLDWKANVAVLVYPNLTPTLFWNFAGTCLP